VTSTRPYLLRALHEWMLDNGLTPQIVVDASGDDVQVPRQFVEDGRIVLNVSPTAVRDLSLGNERVEFRARFAGQPFPVSVSIARVLAIVARENGAGMSFQPETETGTGPGPQAHGEPPPDGSSPGDGPPDPEPGAPAPGGRPRLKVVK